MSDLNTRPPKPSATLLFGGRADVHAQWCWEYRLRKRCHGDGCMHPRYHDEQLCLGHTVLRLMAEFQGDYLVRLQQLSETVTTRRLAAWIRDRIDERGWQLIEWTAIVGVAVSSGSKAIRDPDRHRVTFVKIAAHWGYVPEGAGHWRKRKGSKAA